MSVHLPKGCIVTAEKVDDVVTFAGAGDETPKGVAPGRVLFEIGSLTKVFTGLLLARAVTEGRVTLDTTVGQLLEDHSFTDSRVGAITLLQLATHASGLPTDPDNLPAGSDPANVFARYERKHLFEFLSKVRLKGDAPFPRKYSNVGMGLLGTLLSLVYDQPWESLVAEKIARPLGMRDTTMLLTDEQRARFAPAYRGTESVTPWDFKALAGAGALKSTAADLVRFGEALLHPETTPFEDAFDLLLHPPTEAKDLGLAIAIYQSFGRPAYGHDGLTGGYGCVFEVLPEADSVTVVLINNALMSGRQVIDKSRGKQTRYDIPARRIGREELSEYAGVYLIEDSDELKNGRFKIEMRGDHLFGQLSRLPHREPFLQFHAGNVPDRFFLREVAAEYQFFRNNGIVSSLTLFQSGLEIRAHKSETTSTANQEDSSK